MTIEEFRAFPKCDRYTDDEASEILQNLDLLAIMLFEYTCQQAGTNIDNQLVINEFNSQQSNIAA